ncbi:futalosine hydrolase [Streptomyces sp. IB2014 016-6]|uniref:futalosine hydrolase n=1 Tax=Streptomyces sp. IB2014 016-6 TaxID=2517818 RepID=UPI0011CAA7EB|nr:futalosine hydrolase [Streptomyces sp. IB2014 016-6]TXL87290.1 futalosine hydrolase [Streptomyces sp. IB2014 016-6]
MRVLVVTAVPAEADAVSAGLGGSGTAATERALPGGYVLSARPSADVLAAGVGPAAAAAGTATALAASASATPYDLVVSTGIGGGFQPLAPLGSLVVADAIVAADLGAETPEGFLPVDELGFGRTVHLPPPEVAARIAHLLDAVHAPVLTVSTVTGSAARAGELTVRHPRAAAEAMEGFGVAEAAAAYALPVIEIRAVSNAVGPRDRSAWRIGPALDALRYAFQQLSPVFEESP